VPEGWGGYKSHYYSKSLEETGCFFITVKQKWYKTTLLMHFFRRLRRPDFIPKQANWFEIKKTIIIFKTAFFYRILNFTGAFWGIKRFRTPIKTIS
jgi:hypothetical protein